jgi:Zn-dependent peptidase ImmA (M78 family)
VNSDLHAFAAVAAEQIIKGMNLSLPIDPISVARGRGIEVVAKRLAGGGVSGMLIRFGDEFAIAYATHIDSTGFKNFSVAHELGHYFLPGHPDAVIDSANGAHTSRAGYSSTDPYEMQADRFAAGFLMPRYLFFPALEDAGEGLAAVEHLATRCCTSLHATAIRYAQCTRELAAIVISSGSRIDHCFMSESLKSVRGIDWLRKRAAVPMGTATHAFNKDPENVRNAVRLEESCYLQEWFGGNRSVSINEDVIGLGNYGKTLTVLYGIDLPDAEEEEDEAALIESWTPRFRR